MSLHLCFWNSSRRPPKSLDQFTESCTVYQQGRTVEGAASPHRLLAMLAKIFAQQSLANAVRNNDHWLGWSTWTHMTRNTQHWNNQNVIKTTKVWLILVYDTSNIKLCWWLAREPPNHLNKNKIYKQRKDSRRVHNDQEDSSIKGCLIPEHTHPLIWQCVTRDVI